MAKTPENWLDELLPLPRPEYAKQTEALLTDLLWRSEGSSLADPATTSYFDRLRELRQGRAGPGLPDPERLVPQRRQGGSVRLCETVPLAKRVDLSGLIYSAPNAALPIEATLASCMAPRARGDKSDACVPLHPAAVCLQTLNGLVNKESPANLANAIETMGWLGGAPARGHVAATFLRAFSSNLTQAPDGITGLVDSLFPAIAHQVWGALPSEFGATVVGWPEWPDLLPLFAAATPPPSLAQHVHTPFSWFWKKWRVLCDPQSGWHDTLPTRRFVDWALCLLRTGLAFAYLWEAEFFCRLHERLVERLHSSGTVVDRLQSMLVGGATLAVFEPSFVPAGQKDTWPAISQVLARGYEARKRFYELLDGDRTTPPSEPLPDRLEDWVQTIGQLDLERAAAPLETHSRTANNQKEFVRYLLLARTSDDDSVDQADFYYLARTKSRHVWYHPGPEWLVVVTSLLCEHPGGHTTLGNLLADLGALGIRIDRSVLIGLLEEAGLSTDSPDADDALVLRSGF